MTRRRKHARLVWQRVQPCRYNARLQIKWTACLLAGPQTYAEGDAVCGRTVVHTRALRSIHTSHARVYTGLLLTLLSPLSGPQCVCVTRSLLMVLWHRRQWMAGSGILKGKECRGLATSDVQGRGGSVAGAVLAGVESVSRTLHALGACC
mgnify:CR=1 FL=1